MFLNAATSSVIFGFICDVAKSGESKLIFPVAYCWEFYTVAAHTNKLRNHDISL